MGVWSETDDVDEGAGTKCWNRTLTLLLRIDWEKLVRRGHESRMSKLCYGFCKADIDAAAMFKGIMSLCRDIISIGASLGRCDHSSCSSICKTVEARKKFSE